MNIPSDINNLGGFGYEVSAEQLARFQSMSIKQRLAWAEAARLFTLAGQTAQTKKYHQALRAGKNIKDFL